MTHLNTAIDLSELQAAARILHHSLVNYPTADTLALFIENDLAQNWPAFTDSAANQQGKQYLTQFIAQWDTEQLTNLKLDYGQLFFGPGEPKAMPWGSVYLGEQGILNDESTITLMQFYKSIGVSFDLKYNQPVDHIALFYAVIDQLLAQIIDAQQTNAPEGSVAKEALIILLQQHMLPWSGRCLELAAEHAETDFYRGLVLLAKDFETVLASTLNVIPMPMRLFK
ncbi:TorD/DmsD family molecular chaperone [Shewanella gaetbuli]|uniref:Molecular chaperone TorD family protein n=1 Tax=Shewanella gaetbuli TaxID=220752 RepID=A0A9X1ZKV1_9GAMM|nr:molecular chaperone TorD family protein [Shewanella gaetbuli]MCL1142842.1 molecular chaperone TorD family protein [Shewanella gaetbuli]